METPSGILLREEKDSCEPCIIFLGVNPVKIFEEMKEEFRKGNLTSYLAKLTIPQGPFCQPCDSVPFAKLPDGRNVHLIEDKKRNSSIEINLTMKGKALEDYWVLSKTLHFASNRRCEHCRRVPKKPIGRPIDIVANNFNDVLEFIFEGCYCGVHCAMASLGGDTTKLISNFQSSQNARFYLRVWHRICQLGNGVTDYKEIQCAPPMNMHVDNGGPLDDERFDSCDNTFVKTINFRSQYVTERMYECNPVS